MARERADSRMLEELHHAWMCTQPSNDLFPHHVQQQ